MFVRYCSLTYCSLRKRFFELGHTVLYGEYGQAKDMFNGAALDSSEVEDNCQGRGTHCHNSEVITGSELTQYGLGVVQELDQAAMSLWLSWRHYAADVEGTSASVCHRDRGGGPCRDDDPAATGFSGSPEDFEVIKAGALINF